MRLGMYHQVFDALVVNLLLLDSIPMLVLYAPYRVFYSISTIMVQTGILYSISTLVVQTAIFNPHTQGTKIIETSFLFNLDAHVTNRHFCTQ